MTEPGAEQDIPLEAPAEPAEEPQEPAEPEEPAEGDEEPAEPQEPSDEPAETPAPGMTEKELEKAHAKLVAENERHAGRVGQIMGEDAQTLIPCPLCSDFVAGLIFPMQPSEEVRANVLAALGVAPKGDLQKFENFEECPSCHGEGKVLTGSHVPEYITRNCPACQGTGYKERGLAPAAAGNGAVEPHPAFTELPPPPPEDEAWIEEAKKRGYTIVPPFQGLTPVT